MDAEEDSVKKTWEERDETSSRSGEREQNLTMQ